MGYMWATAACTGCSNIFTFNPELVPSMRMTNGRPDPSGTQEPFCRVCINRANPKRIANGLPPITIVPGAYDPVEVG